MKLLVILLFFIALFECSQITMPVVKVLVISGSNNHNWQETTPFLQNILEMSGKFEVDLTLQSDTLSYQILKKYDVIVSNWNSWPSNDVRWKTDLEMGILKYIREGGGIVFFHASSSVFYKWPEFRDITTASWEEKTWHGKIDTVEVFIENQNHPVTNGLSDFRILDELWINARENGVFTILGSALGKTYNKEESIKQPAIFVKEEGKGKIFHTILGHDVEAMKSEGFKQLILRGTEWAATGKVTSYKE